MSWDRQGQKKQVVIPTLESVAVASSRYSTTVAKVSPAPWATKVVAALKDGAEEKSSIGRLLRIKELTTRRMGPKGRMSRASRWQGNKPTFENESIISFQFLKYNCDNQLMDKASNNDDGR